MIKTELKLDFSVCEQSEKVTVIVLAAGNSARMNGINKTFAEIDGVPLIVRTLNAFQKCESIKNIILVAKTDDLFNIELVCKKYNISKLTDIVCGGAHRQESVLKGFDRVGKDQKKVLIHDGARPFADDKIIKSVIDGLDKYPACAPGVKIKDTVKEIGKNGDIIKTVPRENLVAVQTPQGVLVKEYLNAVKDTDISCFTDDVSIMEAKGYKAGIVDGSYKNIKVTTPEDLIIAKAFLNGDEL